MLALTLIIQNKMQKIGSMQRTLVLKSCRPNIRFSVHFCKVFILPSIQKRGEICSIKLLKQNKNTKTLKPYIYRTRSFAKTHDF
jgi:hypothetical protein